MLEQRNSIGFWRIVFTYLIVALHYGYSKGWKLGVEFFFILSGVLMAFEYDVHKTKYKTYIAKRILRLWPHYIFSVVIFIIVSAVRGGWNVSRILTELRNSVLEIVMLQSLGIGEFAKNHAAVWYVSTLFISSLILYAIIRIRKCIIKIILFITFIGIGYFSQYIFGAMCIITYNSPYGICLLPGLVRGISEMSLGICCYYVGRYLKKKNVWNTSHRWNMLEMICMMAVIIYTYIYLNNHIYIILAFCVAITISFFSEHKLLANTRINKFSGITYAIYLNHITILILFEGYSLIVILFVVTLYSYFTNLLIISLTKKWRFSI